MEMTGLSDNTAWKDTSVLIAGCGSIGKRHARVLRFLGVKDIRICDIAEEQRKSLMAEGPVTREFANYEDGLASQPDAVLICTPPGMHIPMAIQAMENGSHILREKPLSDSLDGVDRLSAVIERTGKVFMVAFCFRYHEGIKKAKAYLDENRIGRLVSIRCRMGEHLPEARPDYKNLFSLKKGGAFDLVHEIDLACWFAGQPAAEVHSIHGAYSDLGFTAPDVAELVLRFGKKCVASVHLDFFSFPRTRLTELMGTRGTITVEFSSWDRCTVSVYEAEKGKWACEKMITERDSMFRSEDMEFLRAITEGTPVGCPFSEAVKSLQIVCAAQSGINVTGNHNLS